MAKEDGHFGSSELDKLHDVVDNNTDNGACLTGHLGSFSEFKNKKSCNYRYQAFEQAKAKDKIKSRLESYNDKLPTAAATTSAYRTAKGGMNPSYYCASLNAPQKGDWDVIGPPRPITRIIFGGEVVTIPEKHNWTQDTWPYWNNAHHLIPKGTLAAKIKAEKGLIPELIQQCLLTAKYNVNHKINMLFLPQDQEVARILSMPRHIQLKDDDEPDLKAMCTDHPEYNEMVAKMDDGLDTIIKDYREIVEKYLEDKKAKHDTPDPKLDKDRLEKLSTALLDIILKFGETADAGKSLAKLGLLAMKKAAGAPS